MTIFYHTLGTHATEAAHPTEENQLKRMIGAPEDLNSDHPLAIS